MNDLISRQAAIDALNDEFTIIGKTNAVIVQDYIRRVNNRLRSLPSTERRGRWKQVGDDTYRCSACGEISCCKSLFCGDCGAKMDGEEE